MFNYCYTNKLYFFFFFLEFSFLCADITTRLRAFPVFLPAVFSEIIYRCAKHLASYTLCAQVETQTDLHEKRELMLPY